MSPDFNIGVTFATLQQLGTIPEERLKFTMWVSGLSNDVEMALKIFRGT